MNTDFYFVLILRKYVKQARPDIDWDAAFQDIQAAGKDMKHGEGIELFSRFMTAVRDSAIAFETEEKEDEIDLLSSDEAEALERLIMSARSEPTILYLQGPSESRQEITIRREQSKAVLRDIEPGAYELTLYSGRLAWEATLTPAELLWGQGKIYEPLRLAADVEGVEMEEPTQVSLVLGESLRVSVFAGKSSGRVEIELC